MRTSASPQVPPPRARPRSESGGIPPQLPRRRHTLRRPKPTSRAGSAVRALTGALATGSLLLALALVVVQLWATSRGQQGPGPTAVIAHLVVALVALALQAIADRRRDLPGGLAVLGVFAVVFGSLWYWWWA
ncbi:hypothetical protein [Saccharopolyspora phatthalungensis]|uniref:Sterol desaturase/sphingolipid hydroxylase (Fatty acid hydroxylase superfamily) n=1 Tax=Saccharopolyspora phatthalungensis TaxID=664693 RepID=A0A840Q3V3_9PSEU|nr:hypothetical protein [Saccharopolyspora phatthalungensis]MBB5153379.1 sterol desaturase/sphingolipid hydroxylase (fatty acid hydroxylase superfamily) [Saccharopolyspora phatthalungensis]